MPRIDKSPYHERIKPLGWLREKLRSKFFGSLRKACATDDGRGIAAETLRGLLRSRPEICDRIAKAESTTYPDLGTADTVDRPSRWDDVIIITARFRGGSTLLWNLFRNMEGCTAYYEPLNERRWFDPETCGRRVDETHRNVSDYWREYEGLTELGRYYRESWIDRNLFMDGEFWDPAMRRYIELLIERADGRPVLQLNRIDFRLPWIRRTFPGAKIVHLYRHPRDQWWSTLLGAESCPREITLKEFAPYDKFYLMSWARDLKYHFPFLDDETVEHPYQMFYLIWKLSYLFGTTCSDHSLAFEHVVENPSEELPCLMERLEIERYELQPLLDLIVKPTGGKWREYADDEWFREQESYCESVLNDFLKPSVDEIVPVRNRKGQILSP